MAIQLAAVGRPQPAHFYGRKACEDCRKSLCLEVLLTFHPRRVNAVNMSGVRASIFDVTRTIFENEGVEGISMRRVAADVGVTATAIYRHFADKDALVTAIVDEGFALLEKHMARARKTGTRIEKLTRLMDGYIDFALRYPRYFDYMFMIPRPDVRRYPEDFRRGESATFNILMDLVTEGIKRGEFKEDSALETGLTIWAHAHGFVSLYRCGRFGDHPIRFRRAFRRSMQRLFEGLM